MLYVSYYYIVIGSHRTRVHNIKVIKYIQVAGTYIVFVVVSCTVHGDRTALEKCTSHNAIRLPNTYI